jgi:hypothetical protein
MSLTTARKDWPGKFVFSFAVGGPKRGGRAIEYEGVLNVSTDKELADVANAFIDWLDSRRPELKKASPPPGMVGIEKSEENE